MLILRPIIKNRLNADFRHFISDRLYIRRKAKNAGNRQETRQNRLLADTIAGTMLLYCLPIIGSYTAGNRPHNMPNTGQHTETETADQNTMLTADRRKYINHSGIIGNAIPGSEKSAETVRSWQAGDIEPESS
jgi:hypothetical protein